MVSLSESVQRVSPSPTLATSARAKQLKDEGRDIVSFAVGEPDFDTPDHVKAAAIEAIQKGFTKYTAVSGIAPLKKAILQKIKKDQGLDYSESEVIITNGGKQALASAFSVLLNPGEEVIIPAPYWTSYPDMAMLAGANPVIVPTRPEDGYILTPTALKNACSPKTKIIVLNSPSNPTGACYSAEQLAALAKTVAQLPNLSDVTIIFDEVYEYITFDGFEHVSLAKVAPELRSNILLVNAFSKSYSMTGWRVGYAIGPKEIISAMDTHQSQFTSNVCSIAQYAATKAAEDAGEFPRKMREVFSKRLDYVCQVISETPGLSLSVKPKGAFYAFIRIDGLIGKGTAGLTIKSAADFATYLLEKFDLAVVPGEAFGDAGAIRISFALSDQQLEKGLKRLKMAAESLS